ncbi:acyl-CoA desaturase [Variovorax ureilyticus]|uniref:Acyl-CoA desaturase n=1 Tax=Variovorax ureilyticus TaxID=1836198 RepID=A0ABU8VPD3_9BURK
MPPIRSSACEGEACQPTIPLAFQAFRENLVVQGFFRRKPTRSILEIFAFVTVTALGIALVVASDWPLVKILGLALVTLGSLGVSTRAHTASHNAISNRAWVNRALTYFGFPFFLQVSATYWRHKHLVVHHPYPNVAGVDDDVDLKPFFAMTSHELVMAKSWLQTLYRFQVAYLPLILIGNAFNVVRCGWKFLATKLLDQHARRGEHWVDLGALMLHYGAWVGLPMLFLAPTDVLTFNLLRFALLSYGMFVIFAPAHFPAEALMIEADPGRDFVATQTLTTVNYRTGWLGGLVCGGLEYQIEHHLLPAISPTHYPRLSALVREYCETHGYPYRCLGWWEALEKSLLSFVHLKPIHAVVAAATPEKCPPESSPARESEAPPCCGCRELAEGAQRLEAPEGPGALKDR